MRSFVYMEKVFSSNNLIKLFIFFFCFLPLKKKYLNFCSNHLTGNISARIYYSWSCIDLHSQQDLFHRDHIYIQKNCFWLFLFILFCRPHKNWVQDEEQERQTILYLHMPESFLSFFLSPLTSNIIFIVSRHHLVAHFLYVSRSLRLSLLFLYPSTGRFPLHFLTI